MSQDHHNRNRVVNRSKGNNRMGTLVIRLGLNQRRN
jgi:hypothetical protein